MRRAPVGLSEEVHAVPVSVLCLNATAGTASEHAAAPLPNN